MSKVIVSGTAIRGHQVASGAALDDRFPEGTLKMQLPIFRERGLDLSAFHLATLNVSFEDGRPGLGEPAHTFRDVKWHPTEPAEDFSFFPCRIREPETDDFVEALIYFPHPETKPEHEQPEDVLEVLAMRKLAGLEYGVAVDLEYKLHA